MKIILASASPRRTKLLRSAGIDFDIVPSRAEERGSPGMPPEEIAVENALAKARDVAELNPDAVVIGADTIVVIDNRILGKPASLDQAVGMLERLSGRTHRVITGVALVCRGKAATDYDSAHVTFRNIQLEQIEKYVHDKKPLDKAGSYGIQELDDEFIAGLEGRRDTVMGLPIKLVLDMLHELDL